MKYSHIKPAIFLERPNRFIAYADLNGKKVTCHVKNTGRCKELLLPKTPVFLEFHPDAAQNGRKTEFSLVGVYKQTSRGRLLINMDSQAPNLTRLPKAASGLCLTPHDIAGHRKATFPPLPFPGACSCPPRPSESL